MTITAHRIKKIRKEKGLSQETLAEMLDVKAATISNYEKGKRKPKIKMLIKISETLNVSLDYLLGRDKLVIKENSENYCVYVANEDLKILSEIKKHNMLYKEMIINPERTVKQICLDKKWL